MPRWSAALLASLLFVACGDGSPSGPTSRNSAFDVETINGSDVKTLEGTTPADGLSPLQQAFLDNFATQCGFCTPGMIMAAEALLAANPTPTREDVVTAISGNVCRCTGYESIIEAILIAAEATA